MGHNEFVIPKDGPNGDVSWTSELKILKFKK